MPKGWKQFFSVNNFRWVHKHAKIHSLFSPLTPEQHRRMSIEVCNIHWWKFTQWKIFFHTFSSLCAVIFSVAGLLLFIGFLLNVVNLILSYRLFKISETVSLPEQVAKKRERNQKLLARQRKLTLCNSHPITSVRFSSPSLLTYRTKLKTWLIGSMLSEFISDYLWFISWWKFITAEWTSGHSFDSSYSSLMSIVVSAWCH